MKRALILATLVAAMAMVAVQPAAPAGDTRGPACANIIDGSIFYSEGVITADVFLAKPACSSVTYTFTVYDTSGGLLATTTTYTPCDPDPGVPCIHFNIPLDANAPSLVCVAGDTRLGGHVADRAPDIPDASCSTPVATMSVTAGGSGAQGFH
jgi:hypothetical protein